MYLTDIFIISLDGVTYYVIQEDRLSLQQDATFARQHVISMSLGDWELGQVWDGSEIGWGKVGPDGGMLLTTNYKAKVYNIKVYFN